MERNNDKNARVPENDPSKAMDSKREVEQSNDEKTDQDFPGYPHYPSKEDIMDQRTGSHKIDMDVENLPSGPNGTGVNRRYLVQQDSQQTEQENSSGAPANNENDYDNVSDDELSMLNSRNEEIGTPQNVDNDELKRSQDRPGSDLEESGR